MVTTYTQGFPGEYPNVLWLWKYVGGGGTYIFHPSKTLISGTLQVLTYNYPPSPQKHPEKCKLHIARSPPENLG